MSNQSENNGWPREAGDPTALRTELEPPEGLETRVVQTLRERGLIGAARPLRQLRGEWFMRASLAAAGLGLVAIGLMIGRTMATSPVPGSLTGAETNLYALLLFETAGYDAPSAAEARVRYGEYSQWVAEAYRRGQFVTGEDLQVDRGWLVRPSDEGPAVESATTADPTGAPLSGIFFIRADDAEHALELARSLPHVRHGGSVVVQKTIPTDTPPD